MTGYNRKIIFLEILFSAASFFLFWKSYEIEEETLQKAGKIEAVQEWSRSSHRTEDTALYENLASGDRFSLDRLADRAEAEGIHIEKIEEKEPLQQGIWTVRRMQISGKSSFYRIFLFFDIIQDEMMWTSLEFHRLERKDGNLFFEGEIRTFYHRGVNEKEKYRPDRAYGHREEPGRQTAGRRT